jgi:hypothetical protein
MYFLSHIRKDFCPGMSPDDFANAVQSMHGFSLYPLTGQMIADLEDCTGDASSKSKYPVSLLQEIALYCTRLASKEHSRLIEYQDIVGLAGRAMPDEHIRNLFAVPVVESESPLEAEEVERAIEDTSPAFEALEVPAGG